MPTPTGEGGFDSLKHLLKITARTQALIVKRTFSDITEDDLAIASQIQGVNQKTNEQGPKYSQMAMRLACTPTEDDSLTTIILKLFLFYFIFRRVRELYPEIYGLPSMTLHETMRFLPQVLLYFSEDPEDTDEDFSPIDAQITFRLVGESPTSITQQMVNSIANKIFSTFTNNGNGPLYFWKKGQQKLTYRDNDLGYNFQINCFDVQGGISLVRDVLSIRNHSFESLNLTKSQYDGNLPTIPGTTNILGKSVRKPRQRPTGEVRFRYAELHIHGLAAPICLVDTTGRRKGAIHRSKFGVR